LAGLYFILPWAWLRWLVGVAAGLSFWYSWVLDVNGKG